MPDLFLSKLEGTPQVGTFAGAGLDSLQCQFCLNGDATYLALHYQDRKGAERKVAFSDLVPVRMTDGTHATFINCLRSGATQYPAANGSIANYRAAFVVLGQKPLTPDYQITSFSFTVCDANLLFCDFDAFNIATGRELLAPLVAAFSESIRRPVTAGEHPIAAYFTGNLELLKCETAIGTLSVQHHPSYGFGGPDGASIANTIKIHVDLKQAVQIDGLSRHIQQLVQLFQTVAGRRQSVSQIQITLEAEEALPSMELYPTMAWREGQRSTDLPHPFDTPLNGGSSPAEFSSVVTKWVDLDPSRADARNQFSASFGRGAYDVDRLVAAANVFDILPSDCYAKPEPLPADIETAKAKAKTVFKALPASELRDRALSDLGRLGSLNLKDKVRQRAALMRRRSPKDFPSLDTILDNAVDARNHFVHGKEISAKRAAFFRRSLAAHTEALEFVFWATDLIDCGWDFGAWMHSPKSYAHPMALFETNYLGMATNYVREWNEAKAAPDAASK